MCGVERDLSEVALVSGFNATLRNFPMVVFLCLRAKVDYGQAFLATYDL